MNDKLVPCDDASFAAQRAVVRQYLAVRHQIAL